MKTYLGIELGSTRIKGVLIDENHAPVASGGCDWENRLEDGIWTYHLDDVWAGLRECCRTLMEDYGRKFGGPPEMIAGLGVSAMMHGYLVFDSRGSQLVPFRTWRNTTTGQACALLTQKLGFNISQRWSAAHLYQAILNGEPHVKDIDFMTTLAGYVHWQLTGQRVLGVGDASGMFPIDSKTNGYHGGMLATFKELAGFDIGKVLPKALGAGENAGTLTDAGAKLLDPTGVIKPGIPVCPPEGDAGTGMVATNSVTRRTGNVSAGTSIFLMAVLEKALSKVYPEIDIVATPAGLPVAMIHCNNCTTDLDAWVRLFGEALAASGVHPDKGSLYDTLYAKAMDAEPDCGGMVSFNYYSGEHMTGFAEGRPLFVRMPDSRLTLANFMRSQIYAAMATLKIGMDILTQQEHIEIDRLLGHGGLFKTEHVGQALMASALGIPVTVMKSAGEGGAWGIALLAAFAADGGAQTLEEFVDNVFAGAKGTCVQPNEKDGAGFAAYLRRYVAGLQVERAAVECLR